MTNMMRMLQAGKDLHIKGEFGIGHCGEFDIEFSPDTVSAVPLVTAAASDGLHHIGCGITVGESGCYMYYWHCEIASTEGDPELLLTVNHEPELLLDEHLFPELFSGNGFVDLEAGDVVNLELRHPFKGAVQGRSALLTLVKAD
ncbi:MAG: hypothetical protein LBR73_06620 [Oscillospiraceae bacterium]|jgi:hypothetical protein|nr:hypothetical protein [Oscillospiraceae bacterium]